jgi:hypothetical protein
LTNAVVGNRNGVWKELAWARRTSLRALIRCRRRSLLVTRKPHEATDSQTFGTPEGGQCPPSAYHSADEKGQLPELGSSISFGASVWNELDHDIHEEVAAFVPTGWK